MSDFTSTTYTHNNSFAGDAPIRTLPVTILSGQNLPALSVVGKVSGKYILSVSTAGDGSEAPDGILVDAVDATTGDANGIIYIAGDFNYNALNVDASHDIDSIRESFVTTRARSIYLTEGVPTTF
jgi:hypothetical protein